MSSFRCIASRNQCTESFKGLMNHVLITTLPQTTLCSGLIFFFLFCLKPDRFSYFSVAKISYLTNFTRTATTCDFVFGASLEVRPPLFEIKGNLTLNDLSNSCTEHEAEPLEFLKFIIYASA